MKNVVELLGVGAGEGRLVARLFLLSACAGIPRVLTMTAANALFLRAFQASSLPYAYAATAVVVPTVGLLLLAVEKRVTMKTRLLGLLTLLLIAQLVFRAMFSWTTGKASALAFLIWLEIEWSFSDMVLYDVAGRLFSVRQVKRLFPIVSTGEVATAVAVGLVVPGLVGRIGAENLLFFAACAHALGILCLRRILRVHGDVLRAPPGLEDKPPESKLARAQSTAQARHGASVLAIGALCYSLYYLIDNAFYERAEAHLGDSQQIAAFLGPFFAVIGVANLLMKSFVASRWLSRFGVFGSLISVPLLVCAACLSVVLVGRSSLSPSWLFWAAAIAKVTERVAVESLHRPGFFALYMPLSPEHRARLRMLGDTIVNQIAGGAVGGLLLVLNKVLGFTATGLAAVAFFGYAGWALASGLATRTYRAAVAEGLHRHGFDGNEQFSLDDPQTVRHLVKGLGSEHPPDVVYCLDLLAENRWQGLPASLPPLFSHADQRVRRAAYRAAASLRRAELFEALLSALQKESSPKGKGILLVALAACGEERAFDEISRYVDDTQQEVRLGAMIALLERCGLEGAVLAGNRLLSLLRSSKSDDRMLGARVLGEVADPSFYRPLVPLFSDADVPVRKTAIWAAGKLRSERLWGHVIDALNDPTLRPAAIKALLRGKDTALPALLSAYRNGRDKPAERRCIARILGRIGGPVACGFLQKELRASDASLRREALSALRRAGYRATPDVRGEVGDLLFEEVRHATRILAAKLDLQGTARLELVCRALEEELVAARGRMFSLLALLYPPDVIAQIEESHRFGTPEKRGFAIELLDTSVSREHKRVVLPLLDDIGDEERLSRLEWFVENERKSVDERLLEIAVKWTNAWIVTCARQALAPGGDEELPILRKAQALRDVSIFAGLPGEILHDIATRLVDVPVENDEPIIRQGELGTSMYIVATGAVRVHSDSITLSVLGPGDIFGELSALTSQPRSASITACAPSHLFKLEKDAMYELIADRIEIARAICDVLCQRLRRAVLRGSRPELLGGTSGVVNVHELIDAEAPEGYLGEVDRVIVLQTASIFEGLPSDILAEVASRTELLCLDAGERLFRKGNLGTQLYIVVDGVVKVHDGDRELTRLGARAVLGELSALSSEPRVATVTAIMPTRLLSLDQASLYELMWSQGDVVHNLMNMLVSRLGRLSGARDDGMGNAPFSVRRGPGSAAFDSMRPSTPG